MKKITYIIISILFSGYTCHNDTFAQKGAPMDPMSKGSLTIDFDAGAGIQYFAGYVSGIGPGIQLSVEAGLWKLGPGVLTLGGEFGASFFSYTYDGYVYNGKFYPDHAYKYSWTNIILAARSAYHYGWDVKGLDTYGGIALGMRFMVFHRTYYANYNGYLEDYNPSMVSPHGGIFVGTSYFFSPVVGVNGELGFNVTYAQIGLILKVK